MAGEGKTHRPVKKKGSFFKDSFGKGSGSGRDSDYTEELGNQICEAVATSTLSLAKLCKENPEFPQEKMVYVWRRRYPEFNEAYMAAKRFQAGLLVEEIIEIADDSNNDTKLSQTGCEIANSEWIARSRLRVDTRRWLGTVLMPKVYGVKQAELESENLDLKVELRSLKEQLDNKHKKEY